jgi:diacylglycerol kinase family enzyme
LLHFRPFKLDVEVDGQRSSLWATEVRIFNGRFHGGVELIEDEAIDDGEIVIQAVTGKSLLPLAWNWFSRFFKLPGRSATTVEFRGRRLVMDTRPRLKISVDGEVVTRTPALIESAHKVIEVAIPPDAWA